MVDNLCYRQSYRQSYGVTATVEIQQQQHQQQHQKQQENVQMTWCYATDVPLHPGDRELKTDALNEKRFAWLRRHDQDTGHIPSIYALAVGMPVRLTENVDRARQLFRGRKGFIHGWTLAPGCIPEEFDGEFILDRLPVVVYIRFPEAPSASNAPLPVDAGSRGDPR